MNFRTRFAGLLLTAALLAACGGATPSANDTSAVVDATAETTQAETTVEEAPTEEASAADSSNEEERADEAASEEETAEESAPSEEEALSESESEAVATAAAVAVEESTSNTEENVTGGAGAIDESEVPELPVLGDDAVTSESGLQYEDVVLGEGEEAVDSDIVSVHYTGYLEDGTVFDSSLPRGTPFDVSLGLGQVIKGWDEGLLGMKIGGERILVIPPELAYGDQSRGNIPANSTLTFSVEVLDIQKAAVPAEVSDYIVDENGAQYAILEEGDGPAAEKGDIVRFDYNAWLEEGAVLFDSSTQAGRPASLPLGQSGLEGLDLGMVGIKSGETRQIRIPPELAYGEEGAGQGIIPPNATLIFEIRLLELKVSPKLSLADESEFQTTDSGLEYTILQEGEGDVVQKDQGVSVHYSGWLEDGTLFDSSIPRDTPFTFVVGAGDVIAGWDEGVEGMKVGEKRQLRIPGDLGYGENGSPPTIPPNATLIFDVEVLAIDTP